MIKMKNKVTNIKIEWEGSYSLEDIGFNDIEYTYSKKNSKLNDDSMDYGIYQIYGSHPVYGTNVLLYIGKAQNQTFATRIAQESWGYNEDSKNIQIYIGRIYNKYNSDDEIWDKMIDTAERMLIYSHEPARNSSNILNITRNKEKLKSFEDVRILNYGRYKSLMPEISGEMWIKEYGDMKLFGEE
jgi:hypothetical protein